MSASGRLMEVFEISGRGIVIVLEEFDGQVQVGDLLVSGSTEHKIIGVELVSFRSAEAHERNQRLRRIGLLVSDCDKEQMTTLKGQRVRIEAAKT